MGSAAKRHAIQPFAIACAISLMLSSSTSEPARAETAGFNCGRETDENYTEPGAVWFAIYHRRSHIAAVLSRNGNADLADRFEACAIAALRKAAEFGHTEAQYQLGARLTIRKPQTRALQSEAYGWLEKAAAAGHRSAKLAVDAWPESWGR